MTSFEFFFQGAEQNGWRTMLLDAGVDRLGISFSYYQKRVAKRNWTLPELPETVNLLLDAGAYGANKNPGSMDETGWRRYEEDYLEFVERNAERIDLVTEFDALVLGEEHIAEVRDHLESIVGRERLLVVWHESYGLDILAAMSGTYPRVAVPDTALNQPGVVQRINSLVRQYDTKFHGLACSKPDVLRDVNFATAASTSWLSPSQFGDSIIWDGQRLKRYPKKYKGQARKRHKLAFTRAGFDADKILADDPMEVTRFTIWSWLRFEESLNHLRGGSTPPPETDDGGFMELVHQPVDPPLLVGRTEGPQTLPVMGFDNADLPTVEQRSLRKCNTCYVASNCPAFTAGAACAYSIPVSMASRDEMLAFLRGVIEMQGMRVMFGRFVEELEGGYPDPNLSGEIDRLLKLVKELRDIEDNRDTLKLSMEARASGGVISRLFGSQPPAQGTLGPAQTDQLLAQAIDVD